MAAAASAPAPAPATDQAADLLQKLSLDSQIKAQEASEANKKPSAVQYGSANGGEAPIVQIPPREQSITPLLQECYIHHGYGSPGYYYGGFNGSISEWEYMNHDGMEMPHGVYGDMYHHGYGYASYSAYPSTGSPVPTMAHDGQLYGPQHYHYPSPFYQPSTPTNAAYTSNQTLTSQGEGPTSVARDQQSLSSDVTKANSNGIANGNAKGNSGAAPVRPSNQNTSLTSNGSYTRGVFPGALPSSGYQDPRFSYDGMLSPVPWFDGTVFTNGQHKPLTNSLAPSTGSHSRNNSSARNQNHHPLPHMMGPPTPRPSAMGPASPGVMNRMYPNNRMYSQYGNTHRSGLGYGSNGYDSRTTGRWGLVVDSKYKPRGRGSGFFGFTNENLDGLSELNRGPRSGRFKNQKWLGPTVTIAVKGQALPSEGKEEDSSVGVPDRDQYNKADFPEYYTDAKFFVIKSYSEDDVHKSIKYNVWASTPNGNKKLDAAYQQSKDKAGGCPVFLFFSVNTSGQFVGAAEMVGPVDFNKTVDYWQQDKWTGCFPVKWHIVKDVPNNILKHITLENNDNKPVTNSRDTQEMKLEQGLQMLKIFKEHASKTSILDDFLFYENRQKIMQEKRARQQQSQKQVLDGKTTVVADEKEDDGVNVQPRLLKHLESVSILSKEASQSDLGERKLSEDSNVATSDGDPLNVIKQATENRVVANGVANSNQG